MNNDILLELYKRQARIIFAYLIKCGCKTNDAEDIVQDSFVKAIEFMDGVDDDKICSWLFVVAMNNYKNRLKKKKIVTEISIYDDKFYRTIVSCNNVQQKVLQEEKKRYIEHCLNNLKEEYRMLLIFKYDLELSYKEISKLIGFSENVVKTYLYRARNKFKEIWRKEYNGKNR
ncbi:MULTISPECIES: RNA polymerase sigma factor [Clostridium]|uniref:RNA polymerase sigma factor n=1 Tax=Clostridium novyi (strain NT) TaxID=386415 RepID=A0Q3F7_CLONN|nr:MULTISPECIES: RNA polymerase sigma factor [Clostridium]ABK61271.1 RNA polymerase sigma-70 factor, ECF subfamily [Clostridium novyi NT]KEH85001.1 RNA polymerase sigma factor [Clostridium novyi A str. NCTC 538]KEH89148.1 RNA polymerase sigma factor [Clostridium novyi A str. 4540]KEH94059.1 RNA polymerase sigma factor [Clostridium botulinum C/D str. It1]KEH95344.1 RNA polymerase sigma factor [Clostridium novyi A str. GD211209]